MLTVDKPVSLVQQKKRQWAQEREEMSNLFLPWGSGERYKNRYNVRNQFASSLELHKHSSYEYQDPMQRQRSPSLPPIYKLQQENIVENRRGSKEYYNRNISSVKRFSFYDEDAEGDTSGYGSETVNNMNIKNKSRELYKLPTEHENDMIVAWHEAKEDRKHPPTARSNVGDGALSARSQSGPEEGRPRWGDRGVATGRLWEPTAPTERLPQMQNHKKGTPSWVERGLNNIDNASDVLILDQRGDSNSGLDCDRSSYNGSDEGRTFLRGQNVPIEPEIRAQRENKRIKALELQSAILTQLEERDKRREEERQKKIKEERLEELRIQRQQEEDLKRLEDEKRKVMEKQSMEQRKLDTLKKALEEAERKAKQEKEKRFNCHKRTSDSNLASETIMEPTEKSLTPQSSPIKTLSPTKTNRTYNVPTPATTQTKEINSRQTTAFNSPRSGSVAPSSLNLYIHNIQPLSLVDNQFNIVPIGITGNGEVVHSQTANNLQLAVIVPQNLGKNVCSNVSLNSSDINELNNIDKLLTPRKYRNVKLKDASTQTDICTFYDYHENEQTEKIIYNDYTNIDENVPNDINRNPLKKDRRLRLEERYKKDIENRPKWGANKPIAQYKKQSEKDPFYTQKRKMRLKYRTQVRQYISQSSEDSRSPSPPVRQEKPSKLQNKARNSLSQFFWRSKRSGQEMLQNNPSDDICNNIIDLNTLSQMPSEKKSPKSSLSTRLTLSQKFINDKYGSRKIWTDETNERNYKYSSDVDKRSEKLNLIRKDLNNDKMDDLFDKKKDEAPILDLSKVVINTPEEYREVMDKIPEFKTRPEKVKAEEVRIRDKHEDQKSKTSRKEIREYEKLGTHGYEEKHFTFMDPIPVEMRGLKFEEFCAVPIEWRMLTSLRPKSKLDEEYFNRLIELGKSELRTKTRDKRELAKTNMIKKTKNRAGVTETRIVTCAECGEEYCNGKMCIITNYDMFVRLKTDVETKSSRTPAAPVHRAKLRRPRRRVRRRARSKSAAPARAHSEQRASKSGTKSDTDM